MNGTTEGRLINAVEAARMMKCSVPYLYKLARANAIRHVRLGTALRFDPADIDAFITSRKQGGPT